MIEHFILNDKREVVSVPDLIEWAKWFEGGGRVARIVKQEQVGKYWISTVFLALDHSFGRGEPILWETLVFLDQICGEEVHGDRCSGSWGDAQKMHADTVALVKGWPQ